MDATILRRLYSGIGLRDVAVLQLMEVLGSLMDAGYNLAEALGEAGKGMVTGQFDKACAIFKTRFVAAKS